MPTKRFLALGLVTLVVGILPAHAVTSTTESRGQKTVVGDNIKDPDYSGSFAGINGGRDGRVLLKVTKRSKSGRPRDGLFMAKEITLACVGSSSPIREYSFSPLKMRFGPDGRTFDGHEYDYSEGHQGIFIFDGRLSASGARARGSFVMLDNPDQANGAPYCHTDARQSWDAKRVGAS